MSRRWQGVPAPKQPGTGRAGGIFSRAARPRKAPGQKGPAAFPSPGRADWAAAVLVGLAALVCFQHPDIWETCNHSRVLLDSLFEGRFLEFYELVAAHEAPLYYVNGANYNIAVYLLFAAWQLPVWLVCRLAGLAANEYFLIFWSKGLCAAGLAACCWLLAKLAKGLGLSQPECRWAALGLLLWPASFFSVLVMGQYDVFCLAATLAALLCYQQGRLRAFTGWMGAAACFKFFPLLVFLPLLLLAEKRPKKLLLYGLGSLWLLAPTTLLFWGRTDKALSFTVEMAQRLFAQTLPGGMRDLPVFALVYALALVLCWFWHPDTRRLRGPLAVYVCLAVYGLMLLCIRWHPQWVALLGPFWLLCMLLQKERLAFLALDWVFSAGYFLLVFFEFPCQMDANLFDYGLITALTGRLASQNLGRTTASVLLEKIPFCVQLAPALFAVPLLAALVLHFPLKSGSLAARLAGAAGGGGTEGLEAGGGEGPNGIAAGAVKDEAGEGENAPAIAGANDTAGEDPAFGGGGGENAPAIAPVSLRVWVFASFAVGVLLCWFLPSLWVWVQCF